MHRSVRRKFSASLAGAAITLLACTVPPATAAASTNTSPRTAGPSILIPFSGDTSFEQNVLSTVAHSPGTKSRTVAVLRAMLASARAGKQLHLSRQTQSVTTQRNEVQKTLSELTSPHGVPASVTPASASPSSYPQRGASANSRRSWKFNESIGDVACGGGGCVQEDLIYCRWTIDPGRSADRMSFTCLYSPNRGNYDNIYAYGYSFCYTGSRECGSRSFPPGPPRDGTGSDTYSVYHHDTARDRIKDGISLHGHFKPSNVTNFDRAGTALALCQSGAGRNCIY